LKIILIDLIYEKSHLFIYIFTSLIFIISSCQSVEREKSNQVEQRLIFPQYTVSYDAESGNLTATAQFNLNNSAGSLIQLSSKSEVLFNQKKLKLIEDKENQKIFYSIKSDEILPKKLIFEYTNDIKNTFINKVYINPIVIRGKDIKINKQEGVVIPFIGETFSLDETLDCIITANNTIISNFSPDINSERKIIFLSPSNLANINNGEYTLHFVRRQSSTQVFAMDRGGYWETEYFSKKISISIN
jgi:hypothetical protein